METAVGRVLVPLGWAAAGALAAFGLGAAFTPFLLLSLPALVLGLLLGLRAGVGRRTWAAVAGASWLPLWLAWLDRGGPGEVCRMEDGLAGCGPAGNPWPWLAVGVLMLVTGLALGLRGDREPLRPRGRDPR